MHTQGELMRSKQGQWTGHFSNACWLGQGKDGVHFAETGDFVAADCHAVTSSLNVWVPPMDTVVLHHVSAVLRLHKGIVDGCTCHTAYKDCRVFCASSSRNVSEFCSCQEALATMSAERVNGTCMNFSDTEIEVGAEVADIKGIEGCMCADMIIVFPCMFNDFMRQMALSR